MSVAKPTPTVSSKDIIGRFLPFIWKNKNFKLRFSIVLALALIPVTVVLNVGLPILFREIINELSDKLKSNESLVLLMILAYGLIWTVSTIAEKLREMVFFRPIGRSVTDYCMTVFNHILNLSLSFHLSRETGKITTAIDQARLAIAMVTTNILFRIAPAVLGLVLAFAIIGYLYGLYYAFLLIGTTTIYFSWSVLTSDLLAKRQRDWAEVNGMGTARFVDGLLNIETVKYFNRQVYEIDTIKKLHNLLDKTVMKLILSTSYVQIAHTCIIGVGLILITYTTGKDVLNQNLRLGDFILINAYTLQFLGPLYHLGVLIRQTKFFLTQLEPSAQFLMEERMNERSDGKVKKDHALPPLVINQAKNEVEINFDKVCFSYLAQVSILRNLTFKISPGSTVAIVGPSGSGKSTIARLILRFFDVNSGRITIDGQDIQERDPASIRKLIGVVPQDIVLFNNTLRYNLCYGTFDASDQEIGDIVRITHLETLIKQLPQGLSTAVGERGLKLSGGERQRIALARALLKRPAMLIFDEATSSLDVKTEEAIQKNIVVASKNTTTLVIAHRLSTIVEADTILVLNQGAVVEQGTHSQLLVQPGLYAALWHKQRIQEPDLGQNQASK